MEEVRVEEEDEVTKEEEELADKLRLCCNQEGEEDESKLHESASILLNMGRLYLEKAKNSSGMLQKLNFIKSAALISGARVRYEKRLNDDERCAEAKQVFKVMSSALLNSCKTQELGADLQAISNGVGTLVLQLRAETKAFIKQHLSPIDDDVPETELISKQKRKVELMRYILKESSACYEKVMKAISEVSIKILGAVPCRFALAGLGSLARDEATLYSKFEHAVLLEEGVDASANGKIREYFRWYSVIFQVIVIGWGETCIPTVEVKSLNDLYSDDKSKNWYSDLYTSEGISFTGRFLHSYKIPVEKIKMFEDKQHVTELIQPVDVLLQYLTLQEDVEKGDHLRNVFVRTRLIDGDEDLHRDFMNRSIPVLHKPSLDQTVAKQAELVFKNVNSTDILTGSVVDGEKVNFYKMEDYLCRPITRLAECFTRVFCKAIGSNLDLISWFHKFIGRQVTEEIGPYLHDLEYAVAVAAEIRLKVNASASHRREKLLPKDVSEYVDKRCAVRCQKTIIVTTLIFQKSLEEKAGFRDFFNIVACLNGPAIDQIGAEIEEKTLDIFGFDELKLHRCGQSAQPNLSKKPALTDFHLKAFEDTSGKGHVHRAENILIETVGNGTLDFIRKQHGIDLDTEKEIPVTVEDDVSNEEAELADKLRSECCSLFGVELESKLQESSSILLDIGKLYLEKAKNSSGMLQKLNFIKSAALISGARVRVGNNEMSSAARQAFRTLSAVLLNSCKAQNPNADLAALAEFVSLMFSLVRQEEKIFINQHLSPIGDDIPEKELKAKQKRKIELMGKILRKNTTYYKAIMKYVSEECIKILGIPPCRFSLVGLGSLSREEVTLYSDFEHVILLEEWIDVSQEDKTREYFRWYSVIFQVIIIGLGETYISTVGVKSLNDLYCDDKSRNWFFDLYTSGGVSFDGRFPYSCKTPIGKQEATKNKQHVTELIQPVDKMLQYLTTQEDFKNGYHLRDVLMRTCFVHGDEDLCRDFVKRASKIVKSSSPDQAVAEQAEFAVKNVNFDLDGRGLNKSEKRFAKIKDYFYRPITLLVGCLCRVFCINTGSNLSFLSWFREQMGTESAEGIEDYIHDLEYAVAVAAEIRLKVYASTGHQRQKMSPKDVCTFVSKGCVVSCLRTTFLTGRIFKKVWKNKTGFDGILDGILILNTPSMRKALPAIDANLLSIFGFHEAALCEFRHLPEKEFLAVALSYFKAGELSMDKREDYFRKAEDLLKNDGANETYECVYIMSEIHSYRGDYKRGLDLIEKLIEKKDDLSETQYNELQCKKAVISDKNMTAPEMIDYSSRQIERTNDVFSRALFLVFLSAAQLEIGHANEAQEHLKESFQLCNSNLKHLPADSVVKILRNVVQMQMIEKYKEDAATSLELLGKLQGTSRQIKVTHDLFSSGTILKRIFLDHGISNFSEIAIHFTKTSFDALSQPYVYNMLRHAMQRYHRKMLDAPFREIGLDLMAVFHIFEKLLSHPRFIGLFRDVVILAVRKILNLRSTAVKHALRNPQIHANCIPLAYNQALRDFLDLNIELSAKAFWKILNNKMIKSELRRKSCKLIAHMIDILPFLALIEYLRNRRPRFLELVCFPTTNSEAAAYNNAMEMYVDCDFKQSSSEFWRIIFESKTNSTQRKRSIEMLMFVILFKWECDGFPMFVGEKFIWNEAKKVSQPLHVKLDFLYPILFMGVKDANEALRHRPNDCF